MFTAVTPSNVLPFVVAADDTVSLCFITFVLSPLVLAAEHTFSCLFLLKTDENLNNAHIYSCQIQQVSFYKNAASTFALKQMCDGTFCIEISLNLLLLNLLQHLHSSFHVLFSFVHSQILFRKYNNAVSF